MKKNIKSLVVLFALSVVLAACGGSGGSGGAGSGTAATIDISHDATSGNTFGRFYDEVKRYQTFVADSHQSITGLDVKIRKNIPGAYINASVELYETDTDHKPTILLATATIDTSSLGTFFSVLSAPLTYHGLVAGKSYAIVLGQPAGVNYNDDGYEWCVSPVSDGYYFGKFDGESTWTDESHYGDGWLKVYVY